MGFLHPELLLLGIPLGLLWWRTRGHGRVTLALRFVVGALLVVALSGPYLLTGDDGRDLVVVVDRSRSMPDNSDTSALELIALAEEEAREGDNVFVVTFGAEPRIEHVTLEDSRFQGFEREVMPDGSDLGAALETALNLIDEGRMGGILLLSDGENNGRDPMSAARRAFGRDVRIDVRPYMRPGTADLTVDRIDLPGEVAVGEPYQFNVWVRSDRRIESDFHLERNGKVLSSGARVFQAGINRLVFRDVLERPGVVEYEVEITEDEDRVPENNRGLGAVRATGAAAVLVLNDDGAEDTLVRALRKARIPVAVTTPESARLDPVGLSGFRAVVLENVAAGRMRGRGMRAIKDFVLDRGGGLLVTGGQASFGIGGYYLSPLDPILPVTMELRQEHRKTSVGIAVSLDRSGSMSAPVGGGLTKMDLANLGTKAAVELLSPQDSIAVIAVDSSPHVIVPMTSAAEKASIIREVLRIESMGGGIFTYTALQAAGIELKKAPQVNKHIILFADAADAEEHEGCVNLITEMGKRGVTLSVIALGNATDADGTFLIDIAKVGGGEAYFTMDPADLPRLFALDTMTMARSTFIEEPTGVDVLPDLFGVGVIPTRSFPTIPGYNLSYLRPEAQAGMVTRDEYRAPIFAFMHQGLGRTSTYTGQIGGRHGQEVVAWEGFAPFFVTSVRWLLGNEEPEEFFTSVRREGKDAVLSVEVDRDASLPPDTSSLLARVGRVDGTRTEVVLERTGEGIFEARYPLEREGISIGTVALGEDRFVTLPPIVLPYSPEFERSPDPERGERLLRRLARESGGELGVTAGSFFRGAREGRVWRLVTRELMLLALIVLMAEVAGRRLSLWGSLRVPEPVKRAGARLSERAAAWRERRRSARPEPATASPEPTAAATPSAEQQPARASQSPSETPVPPRSPKPGPAGVGSALSRAKRAADRKLDR